jgi:hypothetical protein
VKTVKKKRKEKKKDSCDVKNKQIIRDDLHMIININVSL